jgi:hypothetical protein
MPSRTIPDGQIEIFFARADRTIVLDVGDEDAAIADVILSALALDDPDATEDRLRSEAGVLGVVRRP